MAQYKATILSQDGHKYKISIKNGAEEIVVFRCYLGTDKSVQDVLALENDYNDALKKAKKDQRKADRLAANNIKDIEEKVRAIIAALVINIPGTAVATQNKLDNLATNLQNRIDNFIRSL